MDKFEHNAPPDKSGGNGTPPVHPQHYDGATTITSGTGTPHSNVHFTPPPVPSKGRSGKGTSVDTPSMKLFADNIDALIQPVQRMYSELQNVKAVAPGGFYHGYELKSKVDGPNGGDGLHHQYLLVLHDLANGLADVRDGVRVLAGKYKTMDDAAHMKATDLSKAMSDSGTDFDSLMTDMGGSGSGGAGGNGGAGGGKS